MRATKNKKSDRMVDDTHISPLIGEVTPDAEGQPATEQQHRFKQGKRLRCGTETKSSRTTAVSS